MPVERSPPPPEEGPQRHLNAPPTMTHYNSDPGLNKPDLHHELCENVFNISKRQKRTYDESTSNSSEIKTLFEELKNQQDLKFDMLNTAIGTILNQNQDIKKSLDNMAEQHHELLQKVNHLELENSVYKNRVSNLESRLDQLEKTIRNSSIEIRNIPKSDNEKKPYLISIVQSIGTELGLEKIQEPEIREIFRTKTEAIVVDFISAHRKESIISSMKNLNKVRREDKKPQLNSNDIKIPGPPRPIYISEYLTSKARRLHYLAREQVKEKQIFATWTSYGKVLVKAQENSTPVRIENESDLIKLKK